MNLTSFCIRRPAFTIVITLLMVIIGLMGYLNLPLRWIPNVNLPSVSIQTSYTGANAHLVESNVTKVLEESLSGVSGIETMESVSREGESNINLTFQLGRNIDAAAEDVRGNLERVRDQLPKDAGNSVIMKADPSSMPILFLSFSSSRLNERELSDYVDKFITPSLETIDGVGSVQAFGNQMSALHIDLDPLKLTSAKVTIDDVTQLLQDQNTSLPSGEIHARDRYYSVVTDTTLSAPEQFNDLIIRDNQNELVRLGDVGDAKLAAANPDTSFRMDGKPAVALGIIPQSTANPLDVEQRVKVVEADLQRTLPAGMEVKIVYNQADYIRASMHSVYEAFFESLFFVWIVIFAFLGNLRPTFIPMVTIPVCMIATCAIMSMAGFSINTITLMAFVLAIGLVVDDAIVMLENISRHIENGVPVFQAALQGSREITFPIIAMTFTLAAVYTPVAFTQGLLGVLFREFTVTLAAAVVFSGILALTLSPMMCARILKPHQTSNYHQWLTVKMQWLQTKYQSALTAMISKRHWIVLALVIVACSGYGIYKWLPTELAPAEDRNEVDVFVSAPHNASFAYANKYVKQLEAILQKNTNIDDYLTIVGNSNPSHSFQIIQLKPNNRTQSTADMVTDLVAKTNQLPGIKVNVSMPPSPLAEFAGGDEGDQMGLVLMTTNDYSDLEKVAAKLMDDAKSNPGFVHVGNNLKWDTEQFQVNINRIKAADLKVPVANITNTISTLLAGKTIGKFNDADVIVHIDENDLADPNLFQQFYVRNVTGDMVPLADLITISDSSVPEVFHHYGRLRADTLYVTLAPNYKISQAINDLEKLAKQDIPPDMKYTFTGEAKSFLDSNGKSATTFLLAIIFIYLILVAQFESFIDPLVIMFTVPFAMVGAMFTLKVFGASLNIYSNIGLITLIGLIAKHGILITEFANRLRMEGKAINEAVIQAAILRLRPILMTTAAMLLGALPLALAFGAGAEDRRQIGLVITGGLLFGTFFSLVVVPIAYTYLAPFRKAAPMPLAETG